MGTELNIKELGFEECFKLLTSEKEDDPKFEELYKKVRFGIKIRFDAWTYIYMRDRVFFEKPKMGKIIVKGTIYNLSDFWTEIEERTRLMKEYLVEVLSEKPIARIRGSKDE